MTPAGRTLAERPVFGPPVEPASFLCICVRLTIEDRCMPNSTIGQNNRVVPPIVRTARPVALKFQQEIKSAVHQGLIKRLDLEKIAQMHENPASQQQLLTVIHQLIGEQNIPLS